MLAGATMKTLGISRSTLGIFTKQGILKATRMSNGRLDYDEESVLALRKKRTPIIQEDLTLMSLKESMEMQMKILNQILETVTKLEKKINI